MDELESNNFSLGQSDMYYERLNNLGSETRDTFLRKMKDIAKDKVIYDKAIQENVTKTSLLRSISESTVLIQYRRLAFGGVRLTDYKFKFIPPKISETSEGYSLDFSVQPESFPPTNIHILIGRNGVGKTHLSNNMINSLLTNDKSFGEFVLDNTEIENYFANLISVSFSAFDTFRDYKNNTSNLKFSYIGLQQHDENLNVISKSHSELEKEFFNSFSYCRISNKTRWKQSVEMLESDFNFKNSNIKSLIDILDDKEFKEKSFEIFSRLSSGHKIVLLTITRLIETLQEKSLVLLDEPEAHLHPPLLSAFSRALSELLTSTNGVAIVATHSPVILQEVPKSCVWKLRRIGSEANSERLRIETFGENVGTLTNEIFGLEVTNSGFYTLLDKIASEKNSYEEVLEYFKGQLGMEAKAILMTYFS